jgi:hypothetical protein
MIIEKLEQDTLTANERSMLAQAGERWQRMGAGAHLADWLAFGEPLLLLRTMAMRLAFVNRPEGKGYVQAFAALMKTHNLDTMDKGSISAVLWLNDNPERLTMLREIQGTMTPGQRSRLNSPKSARDRVEQMLKARAGGTEDAIATSPVARLKEQLAQLERQLHEKDQKIAALQKADGSLFDLRKDSAEDIVAVTVRTISENKAKQIAAGISAHFKKPKPAG